MLMECPLCKTQHPLLVRGTVVSPENAELKVDVLDRGYAFCNCRNIFYTDWSNMDQRIYDDFYASKYDGENINKSLKIGFDHYYPIITEFKDIKSFCDIGSINPTLLNEAKKKGWKTTRVDINLASTDEDHEIIIGDIEDPEIVNKLHSDCIWMSHLVEHLKDPIQAMKNMHGCLSDDGLLFVSMPDPYYIDWSAPSSWGHWALREHHILWDMDSFIEMMEENGYECLYSKRYLSEMLFICIREYHLLFRKVQK